MVYFGSYIIMQVILMTSFKALHAELVVMLLCSDVFGYTVVSVYMNIIDDLSK